MDASDAAEYVQDLAGEEANIIFGAMYDDSKPEEARITVIATGLHSSTGTTSKIKSRLEGNSSRVRPASESNMFGGTTAPSYSAPTPAPKKEEYYEQPEQPVARPFTEPTYQTPNFTEPKAPQRTVKEESIKIPDFFKNRR
jgi:cell division protein FtsZ